ncbi:MAG TPA: DUF4360 domain-containing protein [Pilimelia sp.]|nr:DUF4360 domain-containing protein [Pilimelia sp.]
MTRPTPGLGRAAAAATAATLLSVAGAAAAQAAETTTTDAPPPPTVALHAAAGEGCPDKTVDVTNAKYGIFMIRYNKLAARVGPGVDAAESRRACTVSLKVTTARNYTWGVKTVRVDGSASVADGAKARVDLTGFAQGDETTGDFDKTLEGPYRGAYHAGGAFTPQVRGECGTNRGLNITASAFVDAGSAKNKISSVNLLPAKPKNGLTVKLVSLAC